MRRAIKITILPSTIALALAALLAWPGRTKADGPSREYQVKAAFIYNFIQFVDWPSSAFPDARAPIIVGVIGEDPFGGALEQVMRGKAVNGRNLAIRRCDNVDQVDGCHVLFVGGLDGEHRAAALARAATGGVLTVGETDDFTRSGGIIQFFLDDHRIRFEINARAAEQAHLTISSKLLRLARIYGN